MRGRQDFLPPANPCLENLYVFCLPTLGAALHFEANRLAFLQRAETVRLDSGEVHEHIFTVLARDESEAFSIVKPLYCSLFHLFLNVLVLMLRWGSEGSRQDRSS